MQEIDFRAWLPPRETPKEKCQRRRMEKLQRDERLNRKLEEVAHDYYRLPSKCFSDHEEVKKDKLKKADVTATMKSQPCPQEDSQGEAEGSSEDLGQDLPEQVVQSTAPASSRVDDTRSDQPEQGTPTKTGQASKTGVRPKAVESRIFREFLNRITNAAVQTKQREAQMKCLSKSGSFFLLTPCEYKELRDKIKFEVLHYKPISKHLAKHAMDQYAVVKLVHKEGDRRLDAHRNKGKAKSLVPPEPLPDTNTKKAQPLSKERQPLSKETQPPSKKAQPLSKETQPPSKKAQPPSKETQPLSKETQPPSKKAQPPSKETQPPSKETQPPSKETQPPSKETQPPSKETQPPSEETQPPSKETQPPSKEAQPLNKET